MMQAFRNSVEDIAYISIVELLVNILVFLYTFSNQTDTKEKNEPNQSEQEQQQ